MAHPLLRDCARCERQRLFEVPTCQDGHGAECPELACVECGEAVWAGFIDVELSIPAARLGHRASAA